MTIKATVQAKETNDYGFTRLKLSGVFYGNDVKGEADVNVGDLVEVEVYDKTLNSGKVVKNFKGKSLTKIKGPAPGAKTNTGPTASKDEYWAKKEANDAAAIPRIGVSAAQERAVQFTALAIQAGAFDALGKAKPAKKLEILEAFVSEQTARLFAESYNAKAPAATKNAPAPADEGDEEQEGSGDDEGDEKGGEQWS